MKKDKSKIAYKIYSAKNIEYFQKKINLLGTNNSYDATKFLNFRLITTIIIFFVILYLFDMGYLLAPVIAVVYYNMLPSMYLDKKIEQRSESLDNDALYFFEVLTLSLETGRNLKSALELTSNSIDSELSHEFRRVLSEVKYGKSFNEALEALKLRIPSETINNIILNISQSNVFGNSIIDTMYNQIDYIRDRQILRAKEKISKIPLKVSVISVMFFIPLIMLLLLSPILINYFGLG